jgi:hypothetical protein
LKNEESARKIFEILKKEFTALRIAHLDDISSLFIEVIEEAPDKRIMEAQRMNQNVKKHGVKKMTKQPSFGSITLPELFGFSKTKQLPNKSHFG